MIEGIDRITYGIEDTPEQWQRVHHFFNDWGLQPLSLGTTGQTWETLNGAQVCVRAMQDPSLDAAIEPGATLREVQWGVLDTASLQQLHQQLQSMPGFQSQGVDYYIQQKKLQERVILRLFLEFSSSFCFFYIILHQLIQLQILMLN